MKNKENKGNMKYIFGSQIFFILKNTKNTKKIPNLVLRENNKTKSSET